MECTIEILLLLFVRLVLVRHVSGTCTGRYPLLPFGVHEGDTIVLGNLDASAEITLSPPFPLLGRNEVEAYVITNGYLSFNGRERAQLYYPGINPSVAIVAPLWLDIRSTESGPALYRKTSTVNQCIRDIIEQTFPESNFDPTTTLVVTYSEVRAAPPVMDDKINSFQVVLVSDGLRSFALFSYGEIQWTTGGFTGFTLKDYSFTLPKSETEDIATIGNSSNVGIPGLYVYRVDQQNITEPVSNYKPVAANLKVLITSSKPVPLLLGDRITLACSVNDSLTTSYTYSWSRNGISLPDQTTPTLLITGVLPTDQGLYWCNVTNDQGSGSSTFQLTTVTPALRRGSNAAKLLSNCDNGMKTREGIGRDVVQLLSSEFGFQPLGRIKAFPAASCEEIGHTHSKIGSGLYWIAEEGSEPIEMYCTI